MRTAEKIEREDEEVDSKTKHKYEWEETIVQEDVHVGSEGV